MSSIHAGIPQALQLAIQHHQAGNFPQAEALYRQILAADPRHPDALHLLGIIAKQTGHAKEAVELITQALAVQPNFPDALSNLGATFTDLARLDDAILCYRRAILLKPGMAEAHSNLGNAFKLKGQLDEAIACHRKAIALNPSYALAYSNLGTTLNEAGQPREAIACYRQAIAIKPDFPEPWYNLGNSLYAAGQLDEAIMCYRNAIAYRPDYCDAYGNLGAVLTERGQHEEGTDCFRKVVALRPDFAKGHSNLGAVLRDEGQMDEAIACFDRAIALDPRLSEAHNNRANAIKSMGLLDEAIAGYRTALSLKPDDVTAHSNLLMALNYHPASTPESLFHESRLWAKRHADPLKPFIELHLNDRDPDRRLRIGYVSADLKEHAVARFLLPLLASHNSDEFEIFCYARVTAPDSMTDQLGAHADTWRSLVGLTDQKAAELIREDRIDILIDLGLHTANNTLMIFARKPAPVQATYLAYCSTTGMEAVDYRITDPYLDAPGVNEVYYSEQSIHLPETYWCYQPSLSMDEPNPLPAMQAGHVTFGSLNNFCKVTQPTLEAWCRLLAAVPNSRLILHAKEGNHRRRVLDLLAKEGIDPSRLSFAGQRPMAEYFELYRGIDIALDPFPFAGGTTTCDALWMGVPVISLAGQTAVSRGGLSILSNLGLTEWVANSTDDYVKIATDLANDLPRLSHFRSTLRERMEHSPLMDAPRFAKNMESAYRAMWRNWCAR